MPSFDVVSEVDKQVLTNSVDQANRLIGNRFDFKGVDAEFTRQEYVVFLRADAEIQINQMLDILKSTLHKNNVDIRCLEEGKLEQSGKQVKTQVTVRTGLDQDLTRKIVKLIKDSKIKVQSQIQGDQVRVTGKKRDELQAIIAMLRAADLDMPLQFDNFRD
ncbi:YajQ family cyclic di-GMP-binding protein [Halioxenophilus sp. WMMB6]|uniref:YajQ family cyclic di-GMP-binding protein n=1 Tax=Halioxenophilus sp. WMMB6 TaxID=3073815 RepID=UPI00295E51CF|nr:YajQ family cyclic di-GMP-binding protein [Halioxenophilus sp. WMMB6]